MPQTLRIWLAGLLALLSLSGCQVRTEVALTVAEDGSGTIEVSVGLDADAIDRVADPEALVLADDLTVAGWDVSGPVAQDDDFTWFRARHDFGSLDEAEALLRQLTGDVGVFEGIELSRSDGFTSTTYEFGAVVDLSEGLAVFSDSDLTAALDGEPLGESVEAIEARFGAPIAEMFTLAVRVDLPGTATAGPTQWMPELGGERVTMSASSEITDRTPFVWIGVSATAALMAVGLAIWRLRQRHAARHAGRPASSPVSS